MTSVTTTESTIAVGPVQSLKAPAVSSMPMVLAIDAANVIFRIAGAMHNWARVSEIVRQWSIRLAGMQRHFPKAQIVICFDGGEGSFRRDWFEGYKSSRPKGSDLRQLVSESMREIQQLCLQGSIDFLVPAGGCEADDLLALVVMRTIAADGKCLIVTSDKDLRQLLHQGRVTIIRSVKQDKAGLVKEVDYLTAGKMLEETGLHPNQWADYLTLVGDACDCIPGCPGIGDVTATKILQHSRTLDAAVSAPAFSLPLTNKLDSRLRQWAREPDGLCLARKLVSLYPPALSWQPAWTL